MVFAPLGARGCWVFARAEPNICHADSHKRVLIKSHTHINKRSKAPNVTANPAGRTYSEGKVLYSGREKRGRERRGGEGGREREGGRRRRRRRRRRKGGKEEA